MTSQNPSFVLGSSSPRRKDLMTQIGFDFRVVSPDVEEVFLPGEKPEAYARRMAGEKLESVGRRVAAESKQTGECYVVCADTIVVCDGRILEKPCDEKHACQMLGELAGRTHTVWSGLGVGRLCGSNGFDHSVVCTVATAVRMRPLSSREIADYVATGEPMDKAGSYGAQGIGCQLIQSVEGSYTNVVGLPVCELVQILAAEFGYCHRVKV